MNSSLEHDNETLRHRLQDVRKKNSSLVAENHRLIETLETTESELRHSSSRVQSLEESVEGYRCKSQELSGVLTVFEKSSRSSERDGEKLRQKYEECSHQLAESVRLLQSQSTAIESMRKEVNEMKNLQRKTEDERNLALDTAEKIQRSYEELQSRFRKTLMSSEEDVRMLQKERGQLLEDLEGRGSQVRTLQDDIKNLRTEVNVQKSARRENELRNAELRSQTKNQSAKIEKLEQDLENQKRLKVKNVEMKTVMEQQRKRIANHETEIHAINTKLSQLDSVLQYSKKSASVKGKNFKQNDGTGAASKTGTGESGAFDLGKLVAAESELMQLRMDVVRLAGSFSELSGKELGGVGSGTRKENGFEVGRSAEKLDDSVVALASVEKRLSDFELMNARLVSHVVELNAQISELRKNGEERSAKQERELQKRTREVALLEKQLDEKVQEMASHVAELSGVKAEVERCGKERDAVRVELDAKDQECVQMGLDVRRLRELHSEHCVELEGRIAMVEKERDEMREQSEQTEERYRAMQQSLSQTIDISDALKEDIRGCRELELMVLATEREARDAKERAGRMEEELNSLRREFDMRMEEARVVEEGHRGQVEEGNERLRLCEERLSRAEEQVGVSEAEITRLLGEVNCSRVLLGDAVEKLEAVEHERSAARSQVSELQRRLESERLELESLLEDSEEKLEEALEEISRKNRRISELMLTKEDARSEKSRADELASKLEQSARRCAETESELERVIGVSAGEREETEMLRSMLKERESAVEDLQGRVVRAYKELQARTKTDKHSFAEVEQMKAEAHTRESQLSEAVRKAEAQSEELKSHREQLRLVQTDLTQCKEELQRKQLDIEIVTAKLQERDWDAEGKCAKIKQLESMLDERLSSLAESERTRLRLEGAAQKHDLDAKQQKKRVSDLENQVHDLLALIKEQCVKLQRSETDQNHIHAGLDSRDARMEELERSAGKLRRELEGTTTANKRAETELSASREHLQKMHCDLVSARHELATLRSQHDRLAKDLAEAVALLQRKDLELSRLLETLSVAEEFRSECGAQLEKLEEANRNLKAVHQAEIAARDDENLSLRRDLVASDMRHRHLEKEIAQLAKQVGRLETARTAPQCTRSKPLKGGKTKDISEIESNANASDLSHCSSLNDIPIFSDYPRSSNPETGKTRLPHRVDHQHFLSHHEVQSTSSGKPPCTSTGTDHRVMYLNDEAQNSNHYSHFAMQRGDSHDQSSNNFFQTMWEALRDSEMNERVGSTLHSDQDESRLTMCTPVNDSDNTASVVDPSVPSITLSSSVINSSAPTINGSARAINCSAPVTNSPVPVVTSSSFPDDHSNLIVYHLSSSGKRSTPTIIDHSNSIQPQKDPNPLKSSHQSPKLHPQSSSSKFHQHLTPPNKKNREPLFTTRLSRSATKNAPNRATRRTLVNKSPSSPIFANRHSPNPTTAISYYERILPSSKSDAEVDNIISGRDFYDKRRFSSLSDE